MLDSPFFSADTSRNHDPASHDPANHDPANHDPASQKPSKSLTGLRGLLRTLDQWAPQLAVQLNTLLFMLPPTLTRRWARDRTRWARDRGREGSRLEFVSGGRRLRAFVWTDEQPSHRGEGELVLLVHGWGGHSGQFAGFIEPLVSAGFKVVAVDLPAHGLSEGSITNAFEMRRAVLDLVQHVGQPHAVLAHSFGAMVTALAMNEGLAPKACGFVAPMTSFNYAVADFSRALGLSREARARMTHHLEAEFDISAAGMEIAETASSRRVPLLVVHDEGDTRVPIELGRALVATWPSAELQATSGLGHQRVLQSVAVIDKLVRFVTSQREERGRR